MEGPQGWYWLAMLEQTLGISCVSDGICQRLEMSEHCVARMSDWLGARRTRHEAALIAIAPAAAYGPAKEWPSSHYAALIDLLSMQAGAECVLVGGPAERLKCEQVAAAAQTRVMVAAGDTDIAELKAMLSLCDGFAGNDSGAMHLAAALGKPAVGIFGSTNPGRTGPVGPKVGTIYHHLECSPCLQRTCRFGHYQCLRSITPEEVTAKLAALGAFARTS
jgi:heptosyltransferase-2